MACPAKIALDSGSPGGGGGGSGAGQSARRPTGDVIHMSLVCERNYIHFAKSEASIGQLWRGHCATSLGGQLWLKASALIKCQTSNFVNIVVRSSKRLEEHVSG